MSEGDSMTLRHLGQKFSTRDQDNDPWSDDSCAVVYIGGWWYGLNCHVSNLNGQYNNTSFKKGVNWYHWTLGFTYSLRFTEMKIRPGNV